MNDDFDCYNDHEMFADDFNVFEENCIARDREGYGDSVPCEDCDMTTHCADCEYAQDVLMNFTDEDPEQGDLAEDAHLGCNY